MLKERKNTLKSFWGMIYIGGEEIHSMVKIINAYIDMFLNFLFGKNYFENFLLQKFQFR